ncbi:piggyBac transposable element-derived protein 4-like, partial [Centruroides sculpturatus]|uniref:piggyBac transposable element-derived protein 4-like n=1 Tax=Centruroides sculpturatus TaxID=218467 RepID=UPI000C6EFA1F
IDYFLLYADDKLYELITKATNLTSVEKSGKSLNVSASEIKIFFGMTFLMSILGYPQIRMYWGRATRVQTIANAMTMDRYFMIQSNLKAVVDRLVEDSHKQENKIWKIEPVVNKFRDVCLALPCPACVCIDEQMIPFTGVSQLKQYVPRKPNPVGLKNFVLAAPSGLALDFCIYQAKTTFPTYNIDRKIASLGESAVLYLSRTLEAGTKIYFDRYFTTISLLSVLHDRGIAGTGTLMKNRIPKGVKLLEDQALERLGRGSSDQSVNDEAKIAIVKWMDNKAIFLASTVSGVGEEDMCRRWSKKEKSLFKWNILKL